MYKKDGVVWPDYNTYLIDCGLSDYYDKERKAEKPYKAYTGYKKRKRRVTNKKMN